MYLATFSLLTCNFCSAKTVGKRGEEAAHDSTEPWSDLQIAIFVIFLMLLRGNVSNFRSVYCNLLKTISSEEVERFPPIDTTGSLA